MSKTSLEGRQRVIEAAATMLALHGLRGISIREVIKLSGAPLGSTYHNFPGGKQQIVTEAILWAGAQASAQLEVCLAQDEENGINVFLAQWRERLTNSKFRYGCPIVAAAIEAPQEDDAEKIKVAVAQVFSDWQLLLANNLVTQGHAPVSAQTIALGIIASIEGAVVMCRGYQNILPFDAVLACIPKLLGSSVAS